MSFHGDKFLEMVKGKVYPPWFLVNSGVWGTHVRGTCPRLTRTALKLNYDGLTRHPQPMPSTHSVWFFVVEHGVGANGPRCGRGIMDARFWLQVAGGICPRKSTELMYYPLVTTISPLLTENIPPFDQNETIKNEYNHDVYTSPLNSPTRPRAERPEVASSSWDRWSPIKIRYKETNKQSYS